MVCKIADLTAMPLANLYHVQTWELYPLVELTSRPFVFNNFILIEKFSGKYCDEKFESVLINCFKKIVKFEVCVVTVTKPENSRNIEVYAL
jgi:hypothetical protein